MKKILLIFCMLLLVGTVSAMDWDDVTDYDEKIKVYTLENALGLPFFGSTIATIKLDSDQNQMVHRGYGKVAEFTITNGDSYEDIINGIELYNINDGMKEVIRDVDYKYKALVDVPNYKTNCDEKQTLNGTKYNDCYRVQDGTKKEEKWLSFRNSLIKDEIITIGIFTNVEEGDRVEWIINIYGNERLTAWAEWTESLEVSLISYWTFEESAGDALDQVGDNDGTVTGALREVGGRVGKAYKYDGTNDVVTVPDNATLDFTLTDDFSVCAWVNMTALNNDIDGIFMKYKHPAPNYGWQLRKQADEKVMFVIRDQGLTTPTVTSTTALQQNVWAYVCGVRDTTKDIIQIYFNGVNEANTSDTTTDTLENADDLVFGYNVFDDDYFAGVLDEMGVWGRVLTGEEVIQLYNGGNGIQFPVEAIDISVNLLFPIDNYDTNDKSIKFTGNFSVDGGNFTNTTLNVWHSNGSLFGINSSGIDPAINSSNLSISGLVVESNYEWNFETCAKNATSSSCDFASTNKTFDVFPFSINSQDFNTSTFETSQEIFSAEISTAPIITSVSASLNYNGTSHIGSTNCTGIDCSLRSTIDIPLVNSGEGQNKSFFWGITIFDGSNSFTFNSSQQLQNVSRIYLEECNATFAKTSLNFTTYDEQNLSLIDNFQFDGTFEFWMGGGDVKRNNSFTNNVTEMNLCIQPNKTFQTDATIDYDEASNLSLYTNRFYYLDGYSINNISQDIKMYLLKSASSTSFILKVQDENLLPVADALIEVHRFYPGEGIFRIVQIAKTDDNGKSIGFFETETVDYKFIIKKNGVTLLETGQQKVIPETSPFTLTFNIGGDLGEPWSGQSEIVNLDSSLTWNPDTEIVTYSYIDSSESFEQARLLVQLTSLVNSSEYVIICNDTSILATASLTCDVGNTTGFYIASSFITRATEALDEQISFTISTKKDDFFDAVGVLGLFFGFFLILISAFMFKFNEIAGIWAVTLAIFFVNLMGLIKFGAVFVTAIIGIAVILTWVMER